MLFETNKEPTLEDTDSCAWCIAPTPLAILCPVCSGCPNCCCCEDKEERLKKLKVITK